ncbi:hypothetical protein QJS10_CPA05g01999 [Acorus calamus]|uniref:SWIM-type domain-containing protein n=1 Tax=Acorus calamus TaxID=4465 RepID=A0AAV9ESG1_ACOCL|nr:hypothetical protein QJS10_CPA05g01999 [Acorus calamus]
MDDDTIYRVTFVHGGQWQTVKSHNGQKYMYGKQFTEVIDQDKIAMIDLWEDIGPWANSTKPRPVRFTYMIPNSLPRKYVEVDNDVKLLQLFSQNREGKKFTLYVINNEDEDEPRPSTITSSLIAANQIEEECQVVREIHEVSSQSLQLSPVHPPPQHDASVQPPSEFNDMVSAALDNLDPPCEEEFNFGVEDLDVVDVFIRPDSELAMSDESKEGEEAYETIEDIVSGTDSDEVSSDKFESEFVEIDDERPNMNVGSKFSNVNHFRGALKQHCIINEFAVVYEKNEKSRVTARCKKRKCIWRIHASVLRDGVTFEVKTLKDEHTCTSVNKVGNEMATSGWLSNKIVPMLQKTPEIGPSRLRIEIQEKYNLTLPYSRVLHARGKAVEKIHGSSSASYRLIPELSEELLKANPGSVVRYDLDVDYSFQRLFVCLHACRMGFIMGCRPFIGLDGCHLKGKHKGIMLSATSIDANNCLFPIAFAIVETESGDSWRWFLENLHSAIGVVEGLAFMSDKDKGLEAGVHVVFPGVEHRTCVRHLYANFKKKYPGELYERLVWKCANSYQRGSFEWHLREIRGASSAAGAYLEALNSQVWSRSQFGPVAKCGYVTNNISESFNAWINKARQMPIVDMVETIRHKIMERMNHRHGLGRKWKGKLVPKAFKYVQNIVKDIGEYIVRRSSDVMAEVVGPEFTTVVRLDDKTCTCRAWQVTGLPCVHAAALITRIRGLDICDFVDEVYTVQRFRETYVVPIAPMPSKEFWDRVHLPFIVQPPRLYKQRGRPRKNRIRDPKEKKRTYMCTRCYELGHNKKSCKNPIAQSQSTGGSRRHNDEGTQESSMAGHQINNIASAEGGNMGGGVDGSSNIASGQGGSMGGGVQGAQTAWNAFNIQSNMGQITSQASVGSLTSQSAMNGTQTRVDSSRAESVMHGLTTQTTMGGMSMSVGEINGTVSMSVHDMGTTSHQGVRRNKSLGVRISERRLFKRPASAQGTLKMRTKRGGGALRIIDDPKNVS